MTVVAAATWTPHISPPATTDTGAQLVVPIDLSGLPDPLVARLMPDPCAQYECLLQALDTTTDPEQYRAVVWVLIQVLAHFLRYDDYGQAWPLLAQLNDRWVAMPRSSWQSATLLAVPNTFARAPWLVHFMRALHQGTPFQVSAVKRLLMLLPPSAVESLVRLLRGLRDPELRSSLRAVLSYLCHHPEQLLCYLDDPNDALVADILAVLSRKEVADFEIVLSRAYHSHGLEVRLLVVKLAGRLPSHQAEVLLVQALRDKIDEVRAAAALALGGRGTPSAFEALQSAVQTPAPSRTPEELGALIEGLGLTRLEAAMPVLQRMLQHPAATDAQQAETVRKAAARGLVALGTPAAQALLMTGVKSGEHALRHACLQAMAKNDATAKTQP